ATPMARDLSPALTGLQAATPHLTSVFGVLQRLSDELAYVPKAPDHGYLFWLAWFAHNFDSFQGGQDANGAFWRGSVVVSCSGSLNQPALMALLGPAVAKAGICPEGPKG
ncbi:MAG TPA: MCE family protein, partial [Solirubrobacteraceae bacterium]|nr:MCE family protein [Solirubrobacteraceae bacterium]